MADAAAVTFDAWLAARASGVPAELRVRLHELLSDELRALPPASAVERLPEVAWERLASVLDRGGASRDAALDLLALDAIVTYALELSASVGGDIAARSQRLLERLVAMLLDRGPA